jgi:hypothetical protein
MLAEEVQYAQIGVRSLLSSSSPLAEKVSNFKIPGKKIEESKDKKPESESKPQSSHLSMGGFKP